MNEEERDGMLAVLPLALVMLVIIILLLPVAL
jgi:hypothetical protein